MAVKPAVYGESARPPRGVEIDSFETLQALTQPDFRPLYQTLNQTRHETRAGAG